MNDVRYNVENFPYRLLRKIRPVRRRGKQSKYSRKYADIITAFDIETTRLPDIEQSFMYVWMYAFNNIGVVIGRTWDEFIRFVERVNIELDDLRLVTYVHNLSYEFQFMAGIHKFNRADVFAVESRKTLRVDWDDAIEFRCSYLHSNMSLDVYAKKMGVEHQKLVGELDYNIKRFPWTKLTENELMYCVNDVLGLVECIETEMLVDGDTLNTIPLTSTGYVRRDVKNAMKTIPKKYVMDLYPPLRVYRLLKCAFRGGDTHANRYYVDRLLTGDIYSFDRSSSYPDVICNCLFPVKPFQYVCNISHDSFYRLYHVRKKALLFRAVFYNTRLRDEFFGAPYISKAKCEGGVVNGVFDNGRVLSADELITTITDVDFKILEMQYEFDFDILELWCSSYGKLPRPLIDTTIHYYREKTRLKNVAGQEVYYMKLKNKLNSIYGMFAQDILKRSIVFDGVNFKLDDEKTLQDLHSENMRKQFICYAWGVWVTAWARYRLQEAIQLVGDGFIYCDTDSVKYIGHVDWSEYNAQRVADSKKSGAYATDSLGNVHYMGVYENDGSMQKFKTLGAKKYVYIDDSGELHITIAGVNKKRGKIELEKMGGIDAFNTGIVFRDAGGLESVYNDIVEPMDIIIDGHALRITRNVSLRPSTYTLGLTQEYFDLLSYCRSKCVDSIYDL